MSPVVVLVGAPGSGKSSVGRALADLLGVGFRDTDADVEAAEGRSIAEQFVDDGEQAFRERERAAVAAALTDHDGVLALGGGAVLAPDTRDRLAGRPVAWLRVSAATASRRVGLGSGRPLLLGNVRSRLVTLLAEREPLYAEVAAVVVDTEGKDVAAVAAEVAAALAGSGS